VARSRTRRTATPKRRKADWVYRGNARIGTDPDGSDADLLGTYEPFIFSHTTGPGNSQGHVLYDSQNWLASVGAGGADIGTGLRTLNRSARAEGRKPTMLAVEGIVYWEPTTWALGNLMAIGMRIGVFEQDPGTGNLLLDTAYSMWRDETGGSLSTVGMWANNGRGNAWERRIHYGFSDNSVFTVARIRWHGRRTLMPNECFALYTELEATSVNTRTQAWIRTLVQDEG